MSIDIIIVNYNGAKYLNNLLDSINKQTEKNWHIYIIDNASSDSSIFIIKAHKLFLEKRISLFELNNNTGFAKGNNIGIVNSKNEFIALINNDVILDKDWLAKMLSLIQTDEKIGIITSKVLFAEKPQIINSAGVLVDDSFMPFNRGMYEEDIGQYNKAEETEAFYGAAGFIRRSVINQIGLFEPLYFMYQEEYELSYRAKKAGWKILYNPEAVVYHFHSASAKKYSVLKTFFSVRNYVCNTIKFLKCSDIVIAHKNFFKKVFQSKDANNQVVDISFIKKIIIFFTIIAAYISGIIISIPLFISYSLKKRKILLK
ncbi:MAG TPA: glycosyltransferase family 2 protein [bacterium]|nr:glycosyltransferase family 2 protein [bacterium]HOL48401.1 glycosyltransferase family 2 protein [bacterium]HPQ18881.1 glycosyltransferase family 2 protein [bacterium]